VASKPPRTVMETFRAQANECREMAAPLTARMIDAAADLADPTTHVGRRILGLTDGPPPSGGATGLRFAGGLHALARKGDVPELSAFYARTHDDAHGALAAALATRDQWLEAWLNQPPQTNETARAAAVMAGLLIAADRFGLPFELLELGASAGLNLNLAHYRFDLGGAAAGDPESPLGFVPEWRGPPPPIASVQVQSSRGVDMAPIMLADRERLIAYMWIDQPERIARVEAALAIAEAHPPRLDRGDAADWTEARLAEPRTLGVMRILFHTVARQYFPEDTRARIDAALDAAAAAATSDAPLGHLALEIDWARGVYELRLTLWPGGETLHLADSHPHCAWIDWHGGR
jgi:hypothetical protein